MQILENKLEDQDLSATGVAKDVARELLSRKKNRPNFGNGGEVENMLSEAKGRYQKRMASMPAHLRMDVVFEPQDIDPEFDRGENASANLAKMFADVVGCDEVIMKLDGYQKIAKVMKERGLDMRTQIPSNFVFKGPPGRWWLAEDLQVAHGGQVRERQRRRGNLVRCTMTWASWPRKT